MLLLLLGKLEEKEGSDRYGDRGRGLGSAKGPSHRGQLAESRTGIVVIQLMSRDLADAAVLSRGIVSFPYPECGGPQRTQTIFISKSISIAILRFSILCQYLNIDKYYTEELD